MQQLQFDLTSDAFKQNPYALWNAVREVGPVIPFDDRVQYLITRYDDCDRALKDARFGREFRNIMTEEQIAALPPVDDVILPLVELQRDAMLFRDPPIHTRLRGLVTKAFTPRVVADLREHIESIATDLLDAVADAGRMDVIADFAVPLPVIVIAELLGVPPEDRTVFRSWSGELLGINDIVAPTPEQMVRSGQAAQAANQYLNDLIAHKRAHPGDDLLSGLIAVEEAGETLNLSELITMAMILLVAGHETTMNLIGNGLLALLRHPDQLERLRAQPDLIPDAVEELLRYDSPVQFTGRVALDDVVVQNTHIRRGDSIGIMIASANRDPQRFADPDTLDIARGQGPALAFGSGIHYCLGAPLARLEGRIAFTALLDRLMEIQLVDDNPPWKSSIVLRGLAELPVTFTPA